MGGYTSDINSDVIEEMTSAELHAAIKNAGQILPVLPSVIAPIINVAHDLQCTDGDINLTEIHVGTWQQYVYVNAVSRGVYIEKDVTYTVINVPTQQMGGSDIKYHFRFKLRKGYNVSIPLTYGVSITFLGKLLKHRQSCNVVESTDDKLFINFVSYGNKRLFSHIKKIFIRNKY